MISAGVPVTVAMGQWLAQYAADRAHWFQPSSEAHAVIMSLFKTPMADQTDRQTAEDFLRWLGVLVASFDGGLFASGLRSFSDRNDAVVLHWDNGISHTLAVSGWDRPTRNALDYIMKRACSCPDFQRNISTGLPLVGSYLAHHRDAISHQISFASQVDHDGPMSSDVGFFILSAAPVALLQLFYLEFSELIPEDLCFEGLADPLPARLFFSKPVGDAPLLIDKVKMHYNLVHYATLDMDVLHALNEKTQLFLTSLKNDPKAWDHISREVSVLMDEQLTPRVSLVSLVLDTFWPN